MSGMPGTSSPGHGASPRLRAPLELRERALSRLRSALREGLARGASHGFVTFDAPLAAPEAVFAFDAEQATLFAPFEGPQRVGLGVAALLSPGRDLSSLPQDAQRLLDGIDARAAEFEPTLIGGLAFSPRFARPPWERFGVGCFVLPRWTYLRDRDRSQLGLIFGALEVGESGGAHGRIEAELLRLWERLARPPVDPPLASPRSLRTRSLDPRVWGESIEAIRGAIGRGEFEKVVAARCTRVDFDAPLDASEILARLGERHPSCARFAMRRGPDVFLGATPERLLLKRGSQIETEALAGTVALGREEALLGSAKDAEEHGLVVSAIFDSLGPLCSVLASDPEPRLRALRDVLHMQTRIHGELRAPAHILELILRLHPTPAVGGVPGASAIAWIDAHEQAPRGWYSGPFGSFDRAGDGAFVVALRSGLLRAATAWLWAGGGIVEGSRAEAEYEETELKLQAMRGSL
ncbi:MAG: isochorismate synthase [Myxococcales bacterium]|nr:isochorismate synthase [Myxococcales bacterium]